MDKIEALVNLTFKKRSLASYDLATKRIEHAHPLSAKAEDLRRYKVSIRLHRHQRNFCKYEMPQQTRNHCRKYFSTPNTVIISSRH